MLLKLLSLKFPTWPLSILPVFWLVLLCGTGGLLQAADAPEPSHQQTENPAAYSAPTNSLGSWIWDKETRNDQYCRLWRAVEIPADGKVEKARLVMTADNEFTLYLDGRNLGRGVEWRELYVFDLTTLLTPGRHILAVQCYNGAFAAGMLLGLRVDLAGGRLIEVKSDSTWKIVPEGVKGWEKRSMAPATWEPATVIAPFGGFPWEKTTPDAIIMMPTLQPVKVLFWQTGWFQVTLSLLSLIILLISIWLLTQLLLHRKEARILQQERTRIARDIHDDMGGRLTQIVVHVEVAQTALQQEDSELRAQLSWVCSEMRGLLSTMDEVLWVVNPRCDTLTEFADYVCNYAQEFLRPAQIQCLFAVDAKMPPALFPFPLRRSLLMAVKEALNNALKHSGAKELHLKIHWQEPCLSVIIQDNGKGFNIHAAGAGRNGLTNLRQRLTELDGSCQIVSRPGEGCRVELKIPVKRSVRFAWTRIGSDKSGPGRDGAEAG